MGYEYCKIETPRVYDKVKHKDYDNRKIRKS